MVVVVDVDHKNAPYPSPSKLEVNMGSYIVNGKLDGDITSLLYKELPKLVLQAAPDTFWLPHNAKRAPLAGRSFR